MPRYFTILLSMLVISTAAAQGPGKTEFITGDGFMWSSLGRSVEFVIDASQADPADPIGDFGASFYSFPSHLVMTLESTSLNSVEVDRQRGEVDGQAFVVDSRTGFEGLVEFSAVFEDARGGRKNQNGNDGMIITVFLPSGTETLAGTIPYGDVDVGARK